MSNKQPYNLNQLYSEALGRDAAETKAARMRAAADVITQALESNPFWMDVNMRQKLKETTPDSRDHEVLSHATDAHHAAQKPLMYNGDWGDRYPDDTNRIAAASAVNNLHQQAHEIVTHADQAEQQATEQHRFAA